MTATATVLQPRPLDPYGLDLPDLAPAPSSPGQRPSLQLLPGGGAGADPGVPAAPVAPVAPTVDAPAPVRSPEHGHPQLGDMVEVYRRRRFLVALALTVVIVAVSQMFGVSLTSFGGAQATDESTPVVHVVRPGDTYPGIAAGLGADDPQSFATELQQANGGADLVVGQRLVIDLGRLG